MSSSRRVRIAFSIQPQHADYGDIRRAVVAAEEAGADVITTWDHFFPLFGPPGGKHFEAWTMLAAWAEATSRVQLAPLVTPVSYRNVDLLADMARTVDHISRRGAGAGRVILGVGAGWCERDYDEYGFDFGTPGTRLDAFERALPRLKKRLNMLNPPPAQHIPILVGGGGEKRTLRYVARHADIWHGIGDLPDLRRKLQILEQWCEVEGRDPAEIEHATPVGPSTPGDHPTPHPAPDTVGPGLLEAGFTLLNVRCSGPNYDLGPLRDWIGWRDSLGSYDAGTEDL